MLGPNEKLRAARQQNHWSQERAAAEIGIDRKTYLRLEKGQNYPQPGTLELMCKRFDLSAEELGFPALSQPDKRIIAVTRLEPTLVSTVQSSGIASDISTCISLKLAQILHIVRVLSRRALFYRQIQAMIDEEITMLDQILQQYTREDCRIPRRQALITIAALPTALLVWRPPEQVMYPAPEEFLPQCAASIPACWHLLKRDGLTAVEQLIPKYAPALTHLALYPSKYQQAAA